MRRIPVTLVVALLALCLTATAVFAAKTPTFLAAPKTGPALSLAPDEPAASPSESEAAEPSESEAAEPSESEAADASAAADAHPTNHGGVVSAAAQGDTPEGCKNHGDWVSTIAHVKDGQLPTTCASDTKTSGSDTEAPAPKNHGHGKR